MQAKIKPDIPNENKTGSILIKSCSEMTSGFSTLSVACHKTSSFHSSKSPAYRAYAGHMAGTKSTGINHIARDLIFLVRLNKIKLKRGINAKAGIFVNIVNPRKMPERRISVKFFLFMTGFFLLFFQGKCEQYRTQEEKAAKDYQEVFFSKSN